MKLKQKQWGKIYQILINNNSSNEFDHFTVSTEDNGNTFVLEFYQPEYETLFTLRYL